MEVRLRFQKETERLGFHGSSPLAAKTSKRKDRSEATQPMSIEHPRQSLGPNWRGFFAMTHNVPIAKPASLRSGSTP
jgi:hypothetical protein